MSRFAISSWSLDGLLQGGMPLITVPDQMVEHGVTTLELCHFHLLSTAATDVQALRHALEAAGVELYSLLIDTGDITAPDPAQCAADLQTIRRWIAIAAELGAQQVRVAAGSQAATPDIIRRSAEHLLACADLAASYGLRTITENWRTTAEQPADLLAILDGCRSQVGLCADTGNAEATPDKYGTLAQLLPRASSVHFKARYEADGQVNQADAEHCVSLIRQANFDGVITLIYADKHNEWAGIEQLRTAIQPLV
ncbi:MAG: sugar phosphate isomerase/epimerase [Herpetosiphonaceae bacterium]|nr:sugar phosphate isomerase/epimerase [Herpetosiphonaceae bacterium]